MAKKIKITDKAYDKALLKFPPNKWTEIAFKYFSESTTEKNMRPSKILIGIFGALFLTGFIGTILNLSESMVKYVTLIYTPGVVSIVVFLFAAAFMNNRRLDKIRKELGGVSREQFAFYMLLRNAKDKNKL